MTVSSFRARATRATAGSRSRVAIRGGVAAMVATTRLRRDSRATTGTNRAKFQRVGVLSALATRVHARRASRVGGGGSPSTRVGDASTTTRRASRVGVVARRRSRRARRRVGTLGVSRRVARDSRVVGNGGSEWSRARETTNGRRVRARRRASARDRLRRRRRRVARRLRRTRDAHARTTTTRIEEKKMRGTGGGSGGGPGGGKGNRQKGTHRGEETHLDSDSDPDPDLPDRSLLSFLSSSGLARRARNIGRAADRAVAFVREDPTTPRKTAERVGASAFMRRRTGGDDEGEGVGSRGARSRDGFAGFAVRGDEKTSYASPNATRIRTSPELASLRDLAPTLWHVASVGNVEAEDERPEDERTATSGSGLGSDSRTAPISSAAEALTIARRRRTRTRAEAIKAAAVIMASSSESEWEEAEPDPRGAFGSPEAA